ncbi:hypothetical protein IIV6-T1_130 [Invertebrate iridescent virus 6]|nr:hypothetical protein IIV6-T1_130 [Invertebrate iridescent virus 6]
MKSTFVRSLFSNLEHMNQDSSTICKFGDCYKLKTLIYPFMSGRKTERIFTCQDVKKISKGEYGNRLIKIIPKKYIISTNNMRNVEVASEAYYNFVANDIEGIHQLVDYLESANHVFFVYHISRGRTITLQKLIETKYGMKIGPQKDYGTTVLNIFKTVVISSIEMYNHGIFHHKLNSSNILINMNTFNPSITNFNYASFVKDEDWKTIVKNLGILLYELWIGHRPDDNDYDEIKIILNHEDSEIHTGIKNFILTTLTKFVSKNEFNILIENLP